MKQRKRMHTFRMKKKNFFCFFLFLAQKMQNKSKTIVALHEIHGMTSDIGHRFLFDFAIQLFVSVKIVQQFAHSANNKMRTNFFYSRRSMDVDAAEIIIKLYCNHREHSISSLKPFDAGAGKTKDGIVFFSRCVGETMKTNSYFPLSLLEHAKDKYAYRGTSENEKEEILSEGVRRVNYISRIDATLLARSSTSMSAHKLWLIFVEGANDAIVYHPIFHFIFSSAFLLFFTLQPSNENLKKM